ncbi:unnamed protein product [Menidia menidia]|uniref:(Atlantic silverside) hypothetical protein n=1 Tax=Menidia menidia TaxID=238744 RepID=A0A8S4BXT8_9TELE|nr:unnamed protein product [Menidia menidia]
MERWRQEGRRQERKMTGGGDEALPTLKSHKHTHTPTWAPRRACCLSAEQNASRCTLVMLSNNKQLVLPQVHPLDDVSTVIEDAADVFRVHGTGEVGVTIVPAVPACRADPLLKEKGNKDRVKALQGWIKVWGGLTIIGCEVTRKFREVFLNFGFSCQHFLCKQVLFI